MRKGGVGIVFVVVALLALGLLIFAVIVVLPVTYLFAMQPVQVRGQAMAPAYKHGEYLMVEKISLRKGPPQKGEVVVFSSPKTQDVNLIKRVVALPGEKIRISKGKVFVDGQVLDETKYLKDDLYTGPESFLAEDQEMTIPADSFFVLGDNREHSSDSRDYGFVPKANLIGKVAFCYWYCGGRQEEMPLPPVR